MSLNDPKTPDEFARAIGRAMDENENAIITGFLNKKVALMFPTEYAQFLPVMRAEVLRRKNQ